MSIDKKHSLYYYNKFEDWKEAENYCKSIEGGYSSDFILEAVAKANAEVLKGDALYEQDGIAYTKEHNNYELLFALLYIYSIEKCLKVCDFGGALGSTYQRYKTILPLDTEWCVVEQGNYVDYGKENIGEIDFYHSIEECTKKRDINVILFSSSMQYLYDVHGVLSNVSKNFGYVLIDETPFHKDDVSDAIYIQHVPADYYGKETTYPCHVFNRMRFINSFEKLGYTKKFEWLYDGVGTGIPIWEDEKETNTIDRGFLMIK